MLSFSQRAVLRPRLHDMSQFIVTPETPRSERREAGTRRDVQEEKRGDALDHTSESDATANSIRTRTWGQAARYKEATLEVTFIAQLGSR